MQADASPARSVAPDVVARVLGDGAVLVNLATDEIFELNQTGAAIWAHLEQGHDTATIVDDLTARFEASAETVRSECDRLTLELRRRGLLHP